MGGVGSLIAVDSAGDHDSDGEFSGLHDMGLHRGSMSPEKHLPVSALFGFAVHPECRHVITGRMFFRDIESVEIVMIPFNFVAFDDLETETLEDGTHLLDGLSHRVNMALGTRSSW